MNNLRTARRRETNHRSPSGILPASCSWHSLVLPATILAASSLCSLHLYRPQHVLNVLEALAALGSGSRPCSWYIPAVLRGFGALSTLDSGTGPCRSPHAASWVQWLDALALARPCGSLHAVSWVMWLDALATLGSGTRPCKSPHAVSWVLRTRRPRLARGIRRCSPARRLSRVLCIRRLRLIRSVRR